MKITLPLFVLGILMFLSVILGNEYVGIFVDETITQGQALNGTTSTWSASFEGYEFYIDPFLGAIVILTAVAVLVGVAGVNILGSGLNDSAHRALTICIVYGGLWLLLSALSSPLIFSISTFGVIIYIALTIVYVIGVIQKIAEG